jgi:hypothetical protein
MGGLFMKTAIRSTVISIILALGVLVNVGGQGPAASDVSVLPGEGKKIWIGKDYYFTYQFDKKPQLGTVILKIELYDKNGDRNTALKITGDAGMPSMPYHDTGEIAFQMNKKGDYLLPVNVVMPGDWQVKLNFLKQAQSIFIGSIRFDV